MDSGDADYDPRLGFRLKGVRADYDLVYMCPAVADRQQRLHLAQYDPSESIINISIVMAFLVLFGPPLYVTHMCFHSLLRRSQDQRELVS